MYLGILASGFILATGAKRLTILLSVVLSLCLLLRISQLRILAETPYTEIILDAVISVVLFQAVFLATTMISVLLQTMIGRNTKQSKIRVENKQQDWIC